MKKTNTKKALGMSLISLLACGVMFAGSTYAWFTDEVVASGNKIESGTLKADMEVLKDGQWVSLKENPETKIFDYDRWEPGYSASTSLRILNEGNLGFRYQVTGEFAGETFGPNGESLQDVIDVYMYAYDFTKPFEVPEIKNFAEVKAAAEANTSNTRAEGWYKVGTLAEWMALPYGLTAGYMLPDGADYQGVKYGYNGVCDSGYTATVVLHMQEEAGNEYQGLTLGDVNLTLKATQWAWEKDGFGDSNYDKVEYISVDSSSNLNAVMAGVKGKAIVSVTGEVDAQNYTSINGLDVTFVGASEDATLNFGSADTYGNESNLKFENINLKFGNTNYRGFKHAKSESYVNCQIEGLRFFYSEDVSFEGCTFVQPENNYNVWTYGATNVSFNDCDFYGSGKAILVYNESSAFSTNVEVEGCEFFSSAKGYTWDGQWVSAIEIDSSLAKEGHYTVTSTNNKVSNNYSGAVRVKKNYNNNATVIETGTTMLDNTIVPVTSAEGLVAAMNNADIEDVVLFADVDFGDLGTNPTAVAVKSEKVLDLNGHTVEATTAYNKNSQLVHVSGAGVLTIEDSVGTGALNYTYTGADVTPGAFLATVVCVADGGTLVVNGGTLANLSTAAGVVKTAIDILNNTSATVVINDGTIVCEEYWGIRMFANSSTGLNSLTINGGKVIGGYCAVRIQEPSTNKFNPAVLKVAGGELVGNYAVSIWCATQVSPSPEITLDFAGSALTLADVQNAEYYISHINLI